MVQTETSAIISLVRICFMTLELCITFIQHLLVRVARLGQMTSSSNVKAFRFLLIVILIVAVFCLGVQGKLQRGFLQKKKFIKRYKKKKVPKNLHLHGTSN